MTDINWLKNLVGMTSYSERKYLYYYTRENYLGEGALVELGCWIGSSTLPLARGISENNKIKDASRIVHSYDNFIYTSYMDNVVAKYPNFFDKKYEVGDSFLDAFLRQISPYKQFIEINECDLTQASWDRGKIEFLFIDAMKSWNLVNAIVSTFFPHLIEGKSKIIHQDFAHIQTYWIHLLMYKFKDYFYPFKYIPKSFSVVFNYVKQIPDDEIKTHWSLKNFSVEEVIESFDFSLNIVKESNSASNLVTGAKLACLIDMNQIELVEQELIKFIKNSGSANKIPNNVIFKIAKRISNKMGW